MQYEVIFVSSLEIWSMGAGKGAPSFYNTLRLYIDKGHKVSLITPSSKWRKYYNMDGLVVYTFNHSFWDRLTNVKRISFFARIIGAIVMTRHFCRLAKRLIEESNTPCLLYAYEVGAVRASKILSDKFKIPFVTRFQGTVLKDYKNTFYNRLKWYPHFQAIEQDSSMVIMTDDGTYGNRVLTELGNRTEKVYFWHNGVNCNHEMYEEKKTYKLRKKMRDKYGISNNEIVLMTLSRLAHWKRIDRAINALAKTVKEYSACKLVVVGEGDMRKSLEKLVEEKSLRNHVVFTGGIMQSETYKYYIMSDIFLSLFDIGNVGNPLFEALISGKAIITLNNGDTESVISDGFNGILLPIEKPELIYQSIIKLIYDEELRQRLCKNAAKYAKKNIWTWEERMNEEYKRVSEMVTDWIKTNH